MEKIKNGDEAIDPITGFKGMIIGITDWYYGCKTAGIQAKMDSDGKIQDVKWFDILQLQKVDPDKAKRTGGPRPTPAKNLSPGSI